MAMNWDDAFWARRIIGIGSCFVRMDPDVHYIVKSPLEATNFSSLKEWKAVAQHLGGTTLLLKCTVEPLSDGQLDKLFEEAEVEDSSASYSIE